MRVLVIGLGHVGLVVAACFAEVGHQVVGIDMDGAKVATLSRGESPIFEPGLDALLKKHLAAKALRFSTELVSAMADADAAFICVGTPQGEAGSADMKYVLTTAAQIGEGMALRSLDAQPLVVVNKSTVPVGTAAHVHAEIAARTDRPFEVVSNPEFLREGSAIGDFLGPDRVVVGCRTDHAEAVMKALHQPFLDRSDGKWFRMDPPSAELSKYAANAMLALRLSFINEIANLAGDVGADIDDVSAAIGADHRIGPAFLKPGPGFGGSCFPKDIQALLKLGREHGHPLLTLGSTVEANRLQKHVLIRKVKAYFGVVADDPAPFKGRRFALWGLAYKADTDDIRESMAVEVLDGLLSLGAEVVVHDFAAMEALKARIGNKVRYAATPLGACEGADALLIATEWVDYRKADLEAVGKALKARCIFDARNLFCPGIMADEGWTYHSLGRRNVGLT